MTDTGKKVKFNVGAFICYTVSVILSWACYLVYAYLPSSDEFTNSPDYSGRETVYVFGSSFVSGLLSVLIFAVMAYAFRKYFYNLSLSDSNIGKFKIKDSVSEWISLISSVLVCALLLTSAVLSYLFFSNCLNMPGGDPFLAPTDNTVFKTYEYVILGNTIAHTVLYVFAVVKMVGIHWLDAIARFVIKLTKKTKK